MITVIDNALEDPLFQSILDIVNHNDFPWYLGNDIDDTNKFNKGTQTKQLIHLLFSNIKNLLLIILYPVIWFAVFFH